MDPAAWGPFVTSIGGLLGILGGIIINLKRSAPENMAILKARMEATEKELGELRESARVAHEKSTAEIDKLRDDLIMANASIFRLRSLCAREGIMTENELEHGEAPADAPAS